MKSLRKKDQLTVRFTSDQIARLRRAAATESRRKGEVVEPGTLLRELGMVEVDRILAGAEPAAEAERRIADRRVPA